MNTSECSSLKFFNFDGWSKEKILEKYETVLASREKQITDLSIEMGSLNDRLSDLFDKFRNIQDENEILKVRIQKRENILNQELNNKEIMFMRLDRAEQECDELRKKLEKTNIGNQRGKEFQLKEKELISSNSFNTLGNTNAPNFNFRNNNESQNKNILTHTESIEIDSINTESNKITSSSTLSDNIKNVETKPTSLSQKPSALDKIRELKERKNVASSRISLTGSMIENVPSNATSEETTSDNL